MNHQSKPRVTVYIPCHNYGCFLAQAIESILGQSYEEWELIIIDDGSTDETAEIANRYVALYPDRVRFLQHSPALGLQPCANLALEMARGDYIIRLDADDFLDESALLVLATYLDLHPDVGLVYPNYIYIDEQGKFLGIENRKKIGKEAKLLDLPAHGACTMVRKRVLKSVGGYNENHDCQDGYELWLKVLHRYPVANISTPLFYYRQHTASVSRDENRILVTRRQIKRDLVEERGGKVRPRAVAIVPAKNTYETMPNIVLNELAGRPLIDYTLEAGQKVETIETIFVTTDDPVVVDYCKKFPGVLAHIRPMELSSKQTFLTQVIQDAVMRLEQEYNIYPDILVVLSVHSPLRRPEHIHNAMNTLLLYNTDSVISVYEDYDLHFGHGEKGLEPLNRGMLQRLRLEREALYVDNGAIYVLWRDAVTDSSLFGQKIGHIVMSMEESYLIRNPLDLWMIEQVIKRDRQEVFRPLRSVENSIR
jgi:CMP-N-acetylneuraminic acid synthetase